MGLREYFGLGGSAHTEDRTLPAQNIAPSMLSAPLGGKPNPRTALEIGDVWACVRVLSSAASSLPLHVYRRRDDGRERMDNQAAALLRNPAPATTTANMVGQLMAHLLCWGNAYAGKFRDSDGRVQQLGLLAPDRVAPEVKAGRPSYVVTGSDGRQTRHDQSDIIHIRGLSTDGLVGLSPIRQCRVALGLSDTLVRHAADFYENAAVPKGLLKLQHFGDASAQVAELREGWEGNRIAGDVNEYGTQRGPANAHRIAVVSGDVEFQAISLPMDDIEFIASRKLAAVEVARIMGVPPHLIGADPGSSLTYQTAETAALDFAKFSLRPWLVTIEQALSADRDLFTGNTYCEFEMDGLLRSDSATRAQFYASALDPITGWMSRDEVRKLENLPGETAQVENLTPERLLAQAAAAGAAAAPAATNGNGSAS